EAELLDAAIERAYGEPERARGLVLVGPEPREGARDRIARGMIDRWSGLVDHHDRRVRPRGALGEARALDLVARAEGVGALEQVFQLAHVAREVIGGQGGDRVGGDALDVAPEPLVEPPDEVRDQRR